MPGNSMSQSQHLSQIGDPHAFALREDTMVPPSTKLVLARCQILFEEEYALRKGFCFRGIASSHM